jgi:hypothetical protein
MRSFMIYTPAPSNHAESNAYIMLQKTEATTTPPQPANLATVLAEPLGIAPVEALLRYKAPMSVSWPFWVKKAALGPT